MKNLLKILFITLYGLNLFSQCNIQASICTPGIAGPFNFIPTGGAYAGGSFVNAGCATGAGGNHAYGFITLYITETGPLNLLINGNANNGFIDVAVFNIPSGENPCDAILNPNNAIGCNFASTAGGCVQFGNVFPCGSTVPAPIVNAGDQIMIIVQNWSNPGSNNFTLQLGPPPGAQTGPPNPTIDPVGPFCTTSPPIQLTTNNAGGTWSGPGVSSTGVFNPLITGVGTHTITYSVGVTPCNAITTTTIVVNDGESLNLIITDNVCFNDCEGSIDAGFYLGATYLWSPNGETTQVIENLCEGIYTVTIDLNGCISTGTGVITNPSPIVVGNILHN